ncbi:MAG: sensor histidine kinase [Chloroflexota bacterium]
MRSMALRLVLSFLMVAAAGVGTLAYLGHRATTEDFRSYVERGYAAYLQSVARSLADYYARTGSWQGADQLISSLKRDSDDRLVVVDSRGVVVHDSERTLDGRLIQGLDLGSRAAVTVDGKEVGAVYLSGSGPPWGMGGGQGRGRGAGGMWAGGQPSMVAGANVRPSPEQDFLDTVYRSLWLAALLAGSLAVGLGLVLTYQIVKPLRALTLGAKRIAQGDLSSRVPVSSSDEFGTLGKAFNAMAESLERNERLRRSLMADITHELRTPLSIIEGTADGILDGVLEATPENLVAIKEEAELLNRLVSDLRELALAEAGELQLDRAPTDVGELVTRAARRWEKAAQDKGVELSVRVRGGASNARVDAERVVQIVGNLLSNSLRYTPKGGRIDVEVSNRGSEVVVAVIDSGEGIAPDDLPYVFERFYRADKSRARRSGGTGLGLAIVKQLAHAHGGRAWAESEPGRGSKFFVALPIDGQ